MALVIAGERSGVGKTTVTLALLAGLRRRQLAVQSFKVGPDYIDPMFHQAVTGRVCRNLDPVLTSEAYVQQCFQQHSAAYGLVEGVMGLFDGATGAEDIASTAHVARLLNLPIVLVLDCSRLARSVAAIAHGYRSFDPRLKFAGVILNRVGSDRHLDLLTAALESLNLPVLGVLRRQDEITIPDRHLGLVPTAELPELKQVIDRLAELGEESFDWQKILPLLREGNRLRRERSAEREQGTGFDVSAQPNGNREQARARSRIAVAIDRAFSFYYADNLDLLRQAGAELVEWSPMQDALPEKIHGLYLGGGFPEVFAAELSRNLQARQAVRSAILSGMPAYAECGGLMYLAKEIVDFAGQTWEMAGVVPTIAQMGKRLTLGYRQATLLQDSPLLAAGETVWGHEFHRSHLQTESPDPLYQLRGYDRAISTQFEGWRLHQLHASYVHLHWGGTPALPARFVDRCRRFAERQSVS